MRSKQGGTGLLRRRLRVCQSNRAPYMSSLQHAVPPATADREACLVPREELNLVIERHIGSHAQGENVTEDLQRELIDQRFDWLFEIVDPFKSTCYPCLLEIQRNESLAQKSAFEGDLVQESVVRSYR